MKRISPMFKFLAVINAIILLSGYVYYRSTRANPAQQRAAYAEAQEIFYRTDYDGDAVLTSSKSSIVFDGKEGRTEREMLPGSKALVGVADLKEVTSESTMALIERVFGRAAEAQPAAQPHRTLYSSTKFGTLSFEDLQFFEWDRNSWWWMGPRRAEANTWQIPYRLSNRDE